MNKNKNTFYVWALSSAPVFIPQLLSLNFIFCEYLFGGVGKRVCKKGKFLFPRKEEILTGGAPRAPITLELGITSEAAHLAGARVGTRNRDVVETIGAVPHETTRAPRAPSTITPLRKKRARKNQTQKKVKMPHRALRNRALLLSFILFWLTFLLARTKKAKALFGLRNCLLEINCGGARCELTMPSSKLSPTPQGVPLL